MSIDVRSATPIQLIALGGLLHDIGKLYYRAGVLPGDVDSVPGDHVQAGLAFARYLYGDHPVPVEVLEAIAFHHAKYLNNGSPHLDSMVPTTTAAWIVYEADNIAAGSDRREKEKNLPDGEGQSYPDRFDRCTSLLSAFHHLQQDTASPEYGYPLTLVKDKNFRQPIVYPSRDKRIGNVDYRELAHQSLRLLSEGRDHYRVSLNSLLQLMEATLSFIPSDTYSGRWADISLFEHLKLTAALAVAMYTFHAEQAELADIKKLTHWDMQDRHRDIERFVLLGGDLSGIQSFIYTISNQGALKLLRARSFYLEILLEHVVDEILDELELSRAHVIFSGGGRFTLLLPNTAKVKGCSDWERKFNNWLTEQFNGRLYLAISAQPCTAKQLMEAASEVSQALNQQLSTKKQRHYANDPDQLRLLLEPNKNTGTDECVVCHVDHVKLIDIDNGQRRCEFCGSLHNLGKQIMTAKYLVVQPDLGGALLLPGLKSPASLRLEKAPPVKLESRERVYGINEWLSGSNVHAQLWIGRYMPDNDALDLPDFKNLAEHATGIRRLAVLRADVDDLGTVFGERLKNQMNTLSRVA
ncbi:MAG: type III-A CRISPR-associated protein Cas10/Csm1, partial [Cyanobacteria bacterium NC_groundwater_1444_Ag_S-0.65um_54_12]|nr:type III-A CRISPR-associated protein Cas10/Csm1 [Cyanobacteria bacterium NC_groundwater_1444_Ag_S-0.65um_54_12]